MDLELKIQVGLAILFGLSEVLSLIPSIKSNGIFQLIKNMLNSVKKSKEKKLEEK